MKNAFFRLIFLVTRMLRPKLASPASNTFLVLQYQMPLGCCVHGTPLYAAIKEQCKTSQPDPKVIVATRGLGAEVLQHNPDIDHIIVTDDPTPSLAAKWRVARQIRTELHSRDLQPSLILQDASSKAGSNALLAALLHLAPTRGFANAPELYDQHLDYDVNRSLIDNNLRLAGNAPHREPAVYFTSRDLDYARSLLAGNLVTVAFVLQGSGGQNTFWHDERFAEVIRHVESLGHSTIFLGTAADAANIDCIRTLASSQGHSLAGQTTIPQLAAVLALTDLLVTLDTGSMHIGRAVELPMVVLGPSWQKPLEWLPLNVATARILRSSDRTDVPSDYRLDEISSASVIAAMDDLLAQFPPSPTVREARAAQRLSRTRM